MEGQIVFYQDLQKEITKKKDTILSLKELVRVTPDSILIKYFPIGDTIQTKIYATCTKFLWRHYASETTATAIVKEHKLNNLLIEIITIETRRKLTPDRNIGDIYEAELNACSLLPPKNWTCE